MNDKVVGVQVDPNLPELEAKNKYKYWFAGGELYQVVDLGNNEWLINNEVYLNLLLWRGDFRPYDIDYFGLKFNNIILSLNAKNPYILAYYQENAKIKIEHKFYLNRSSTRDQKLIGRFFKEHAKNIANDTQLQDVVLGYSVDGKAYPLWSPLLREVVDSANDAVYWFNLEPVLYDPITNRLAKPDMPGKPDIHIYGGFDIVNLGSVQPQVFVHAYSPHITVRPLNLSKFFAVNIGYELDGKDNNLVVLAPQEDSFGSMSLRFVNEGTDKVLEDWNKPLTVFSSENWVKDKYVLTSFIRDNDDSPTRLTEQILVTFLRKNPVNINFVHYTFPSISNTEVQLVWDDLYSVEKKGYFFDLRNILTLPAVGCDEAVIQDYFVCLAKSDPISFENKLTPLAEKSDLHLFDAVIQSDRKVYRVPGKKTQDGKDTIQPEAVLKFDSESLKFLKDNHAFSINHTFSIHVILRTGLNTFSRPHRIDLILKNSLEKK